MNTSVFLFNIKISNEMVHLQLSQAHMISGWYPWFKWCKLKLVQSTLWYFDQPMWLWCHLVLHQRLNLPDYLEEEVDAASFNILE